MASLLPRFFLVLAIFAARPLPAPIYNFPLNPNCLRFMQDTNADALPPLRELPENTAGVVTMVRAELTRLANGQTALPETSRLAESLPGHLTDKPGGRSAGYGSEGRQGPVERR